MSIIQKLRSVFTGNDEQQRPVDVVVYFRPGTGSTWFEPHTESARRYFQRYLQKNGLYGFGREAGLDVIADLEKKGMTVHKSPDEPNL